MIILISLAWMRIIFAEGPRQVVNALTLYSVMQANLVPTGQHKARNGHSAIAQFFVNLKILASSNREQAAILLGMLFTLVIWAIAAMSLFVAVMFYLTFLWHHIPNKDNGLTNYCRRKIDSRLQKIVGVKVNKALAKVDSSRKVNYSGSAGTGMRPPQITRQPTLPLFEIDPYDTFHAIPLSRKTTESSLPLYVSRQSSRTGNFPNNQADGKPTFFDISPFSARPPPPRIATQSSTFSDASYASNAPLMREPAEMGYDPQTRAYPPVPPSRMTSDQSTNSIRSAVERSSTRSSHGAQRSFHSAWQPAPAMGRRTPESLPMGLPSRQNTNVSAAGLSNARPPPPTQHQSFNHTAPRFPIDDYDHNAPRPQTGNGTLWQKYEMQPHRPTPPPTNDAYIAFNPTLGASHPTPINNPSCPLRRLPTRNPSMPTRPYATSVPWPLAAPPQRSGTAPVPMAARYGFRPPPSLPNSEPQMALPARAATAGLSAAVA